MAYLNPCSSDLRETPGYVLFKGALAYRDSFAALCGEISPKIGLALFDDGLKTLGALVREVHEERIRCAESRVSSQVCCRALELLSLLSVRETRRVEGYLLALMGQPSVYLWGFGRWPLPWRGRRDSDSHVVMAAQDALERIVGWHRLAAFPRSIPLASARPSRDCFIVVAALRWYFPNQTEF